MRDTSQPGPSPVPSGEPRTWRDACADFAAEQGLTDEVLVSLDAFRSPWPRGGSAPKPETRFAGSFGELETRVTASMPDQVGLLATLQREVDSEQAAMFVRRLAAVDERLSSAVDPAARLLRVGFRVRLGGILAAEAPRALRLRALADFYYSQLGASLHREKRVSAPSLKDAARSIRYQQIGPGVEHVVLDGDFDRGPVHAGLLRVDPRVARIEAQDLRQLRARGKSFASYVDEVGAIAGTSGGFFLYSEADIRPPSKRFDPVGLLVSNGQVLNPPTHRRASLLIDRGGRAAIQVLGAEGLKVRIGGRTFRVRDVVNRAHGDWGPPRRSVAVVGPRVVAVGERLEVPLAGMVFPVPEDMRVNEGDRVDFDLPLRAGLAGGPMLVEASRVSIDLRAEDFWAGAPPQTFSQDETGDRNLLPRLAIGIDAEGRLIFAAVDGRNFQRALGMTLQELGDFMLDLGCVRAANFDGGSSKRMVVRGRTVDLASTDILGSDVRSRRVRPVHTGLLIFAEGGPVGSS